MRFFKLFFLYLCISMPFNINASTIFNLSGIETLEWLELTATVGKSRVQVEGLISSGGALENWRYATRSEVEILYDSLWGGVAEGYSNDNYLGARYFFDVFGNHNFFGDNGYDENGASSWSTIFGSTLECGGDINSSCQGLVAIYDMDYGASLNAGYFHDDYGLSTGLDSINNQLTVTSLFGYPFLGSHLVREVAVIPLPAAFWLFGSGLIALIGMVIRKNANLK